MSGRLTQEETEQLVRKLREIRECLPFLIQLTPSERIGGLKMGDRAMAFVERALQIARERPQLMPSYIDLEEMERDFELWKNLGVLIREISSLLEALEDTRMGAGADAYSTALLIYGALKQSAQAGVPGVDTLIAELSAHFDRAVRGGGSRQTAPPTESAGGTSTT